MLSAFIPTWATRVVVYLTPINMRSSATLLRRICEDEIGISPDGSTLFIFTNKSRDSLAMYSVDHTGDQVLMKKLDKGAFLLPARPADGAKFVSMSPKMVPRLFRA